MAEEEPSEEAAMAKAERGGGSSNGSGAERRGRGDRSGAERGATRRKKPSEEEDGSSPGSHAFIFERLSLATQPRPDKLQGLQPNTPQVLQGCSRPGRSTPRTQSNDLGGLFPTTTTGVETISNAKLL